MIKEKKIQDRLEIIFIVTLFIIIAIIQIGNYSNRMAIAHGDDWPQTYSYFIKYPDRYQNDILSTYGYQQGFATIQNLIPVSLYYFFNISSDSPTYLLIIAQFVLLALSFRRFSKTVFKNSLIGLLSALLIVGAEVYNWNLADYGHVMYSPYAGHLVIPFIIYAFSFMLERKTKLMSISLLIGGMIHPTLTLYTIMIIGLYEIFKSKKLFPSNILFVLLALIILTVLPRLFIQNFFTVNDLLTFEEMRSGLQMNQHMTLINLNPRAIAFLLFFPLIFLGLREIHEISKDYLILFISSLAACVIFIILHYLGWSFNILYIIQLIPHRATQIFTIISIPIVISFLLKKSKCFSILPNLLYVVFIYKLITSKSLAYILSHEYLYFIIAICIIEILEIFLSKNIYAANFFSNIGNWSKRFFIEINNEIFIKFIKILSISVFLFSSFIKSVEIGSISRKEEYYANYEIQEWINNNIDENALIANSGRVVTQRASVRPSPERWYVYNRVQAVKDYDDRIYQFFYDWYEDSSLTDSQIEKIIFDEEAAAAFCRQFKCDYILRKNNEPLTFELIWMNSYYSLYKIPVNNQEKS